MMHAQPTIIDVKAALRTAVLTAEVPVPAA